MAFDFLADPLLTWRDAQYVEHRSTLPGILAGLQCGDVEDFPYVRPHQLDSWMMFLTQLAAIATARAQGAATARNEEDWCQLFEGLTGGQHEPWSLVVNDLSKPALLQPPVPEGVISAWKSVRFPDDIDILITSKSHDVKQAIIGEGSPEVWLYALVSLQTMQGYPGRGYTRVARMKGGYGSRPRVGLVPDQRLAAGFRRDLAVLHDETPNLLARGLSPAGVALAWLPPWTGNDSLAMPTLAPHFIEVCRRMRLTVDEEAVVARYTTNEVRRCAPEIETGDVGDPWIPIERDDGGALTIGARGFHYSTVLELLSGTRYEPSAALRVQPNDPPLLIFNAGVMARGQGKSDGLHGRVLPIEGPVRRRLASSEGRSALGERGALFVERAARMRSKVLFPSLKALALDASPISDTFDQQVDRVFFDRMFALIETDVDEAIWQWSSELVAIARAQLDEAIARTPAPAMRCFAAGAAAELVFNRACRMHFPELTTQLNDSVPTDA